jgi:hypothetical protein
MWLLDANMDVHLLSVLRQYGRKCDATSRRGWQALSNGDLVAAAVMSGFSCLLTQDRLFGQAAGKALKAYPLFSVVVVHLPQRPWKQYQRDFKSAWAKSPISPVPGRIAVWPASAPRSPAAARWIK